MKKQSFFCALMALVAMGVATVSCTNSDNPVSNTAPSAKYLLVKDSLASTEGNYKTAYWEYDAEGRVVKEIVNFYNVDVIKSHAVYNFSYSPNLITKTREYSNGDTKSAYYHLNSKGLIEQVEDEFDESVYIYEYNDDDRIVAFIEDGRKDKVVWKNDDLEGYVFDDGTTMHYTSSDYEIEFPYLTPYANYFDSSLSKMGYYGKPQRHLIAQIDVNYEDEDKSFSITESFDYVVRNGLVMEFIVSLDGESAHHYLTWEKQ